MCACVSVGGESAQVLICGSEGEKIKVTVMNKQIVKVFTYHTLHPIWTPVKSQTC